MAEHGAARLRAALLNPAAVFASPEEVERDAALSRREKLAILASWEQDARELAVAEQENMAGGEASRLEEVVAARVRLTGGTPDEEAGRPRERGPSAPRARHFARPVRETVHADHEIDEVALRLSLQDHPIVPVVDADQIVGVIGRAELAEAERRKAEKRGGLTARVLMTTNLAFCYLDDDVPTVLALLDEHGSDYLLVTDRDRVLVGTLGRDQLPPVSAGDRRPLRADVAGPRTPHAQGIASTIQPGGLDVYAERPKLGTPRD